MVTLPPTRSAVVSHPRPFMAQYTCADAFVKELFPAVANLQENLFDGAQCGEEVFGIIV